MSEPTKIKWRIAGEQVVSCNCSWGCPCQFNALPTTGHCEATAAWQIKEGYFSNTRFDGVRFASAVWWPGAVHEGNGVRRTIVDEQATNEQREALIALANGQHGGVYFEVFTAVRPNRIEPLFAPINFNVDREKLHATTRIQGIVESEVEPIRNPATGEEHRARIVLPTA
jgi:hypothetical protein